MPTSPLPELKHTYQNIVMDTTRWAGFENRPGDILVCTSYKAGTTWMQMICALLVFNETEFYAPLTDIGPWLERRGNDIDEIHARFAAQTHRRIIKTHTPLDGLPYFDDAVYLFVGRDPRDVFMSLMNHLKNGSPEFRDKLLADAGIPTDTEFPELPDDPNVLFRIWLTTPSFEWEQDGFPYWSHLSHARTFWEHRHLPNLHFFHYADLKDDLDGEMRRVADVLGIGIGIDVDESNWPRLVEAATFDSMKSQADQLAPDVTDGAWLDNANFFHQGVNGRWRDALDAESLALYDQLVGERLPAPLRRFLEDGVRVAGNPKEIED